MFLRYHSGLNTRFLVHTKAASQALNHNKVELPLPDNLFSWLVLNTAPRDTVLLHSSNIQMATLAALVRI